MKSVYIAGPYTAPDQAGEDANIRRAAEEAYWYMCKGWAVFCPHTMTSIIDREFNQHGPLGWDEWLKTDLYWLSRCDAIHMVEGWRESKGAQLEYLVAQSLGLEIKGDV